ncbi:olfactory receptor 6F1-like isoform X1 [Ascaphus truei]|uniref:olfactory receptor 6F1-like isoform X1 n=2 Tax=Ascaphus truei TaxID=8439 RepID=UPI003F59EE15
MKPALETSVFSTFGFIILNLLRRILSRPGRLCSISPPNMCEMNQTQVSEFLLLGFQGLHKQKFLLFILFLVIYIMTVTGNLLIIVLVSTSHKLHSPMYFFLSHVSFTDILITTDIVPNMLRVILEEGSTITVACCITQLYLFGTITIAECLLLSVMSYDRYLAICSPLHYMAIMHFKFQYYLVIWSWLLGFIAMPSIGILIWKLQFCGSNVIDHFFCDVDPLLELSSSDTSLVKIENFAISTPVTLFPFLFIVVTYVCIFHTILKIPSTTGKQKTFSTCSSHLTVVCLYYGSLIIIYVAPRKKGSLSVNKVLSLLYSVVTPLFNPIIYSLRSQQIRSALRKQVSMRWRG